MNIRYGHNFVYTTLFLPSHTTVATHCQFIEFMCTRPTLLRLQVYYRPHLCVYRMFFLARKNGPVALRTCANLHFTTPPSLLQAASALSTLLQTTRVTSVFLFTHTETTCRLAQLRPPDFTACHVDGVYLHVSVCFFLLTAPGPIFG